MKHTPGPWKAQAIKGHNNTLVYKRIVANGEPVAFAGVYKGHNTEANAHLIAAAPELLEMLKISLTYLYKAQLEEVETVVPISHVTDKIEALINKAEGK